MENKDFQTFKAFLAKNNIAEITIELNRDNTLNWDKITESIKETAEKYGVKFVTNEDIGKTGDDTVGYGVKGKLKAKGGMEKGEVLNPNTEVTQDDKKILSSIDNKLVQTIKILGELENFVIEYGKINPKPISDILAQIRSYQEALLNELENI